MSKEKPATLDPEEYEEYLIGLANDLAEKKLRDGTAPVPLIKHYLQLGTRKAKLEQVKLEHEIKLLEARTEEIKAAAHNDQLFQEAIDAMRRYTGHKDEYYDEDL